MLIRISLIVAIVAALAAGALNIVEIRDKIGTLITERDDFHTQRDQVQAELNTTKRDLAKTKDDLTQTQQQLAEHPNPTHQRHGHGRDPAETRRRIIGQTGQDHPGPG